MNDGRTNRRSFRVSESVYLRYEILSDEEFQNGIDHRKIRLGDSDSAHAMLIDIDARLGETMLRLGAESETLGKCITLLNDKINVIVRETPSFRESKAELAKSPPLVCDVGADGIVFPSQRQLEVGTKLSMQILLASDQRFIETFCRVVRHTESPAGNDAQNLPFGIAVEFQGLQPAQREILIQHMFNRESETLRMRRLQLDKDEA